MTGLRILSRGLPTGYRTMTISQRVGELKLQLVIAILTLILWPADSPGSLADGELLRGSCLKRSVEASSHEGYAHFRVENECADDMVVTYCIVRDSEPGSQAASECSLERRQAIVRNPLVSFAGWVLAPRLLEEAIGDSEAELDRHRRFQEVFPERPVAKGVDEALAKHLVGMYVLEAGTAWTSSEYAQAKGRPVAHAILAGCPVTAYLAGSCWPDAIAQWRRFGRPRTLREAQRVAPF